MNLMLDNTRTNRRTYISQNQKRLAFGTNAGDTFKYDVNDTMTLLEESNDVLHMCEIARPISALRRAPRL